MKLRYVVLIASLTSLNILGSEMHPYEEQPNYFENPDGLFLFGSEEPVDLESIVLDDLDSPLLIAPHDLSYQDVMTPANTLSTHPSEKKSHSCNMCDKSFTRPNHLKAHKRTHTEAKSYSCTTCNKTFVRQSDLTRHNHMVQCADKKPYACDGCSLSFTYKSGLERHSIIHMGKQPYSCDICGRSFAHKRNLTEHAMTHTKEKPYVCDTCGRSFARRYILTEHKRLHSNEISFLCHCGAIFKTRGTFQYHTRTEHPKASTAPTVQEPEE